MAASESLPHCGICHKPCCPGLLQGEGPEAFSSVYMETGEVKLCPHTRGDSSVYGISCPSQVKAPRQKKTPKQKTVPKSQLTQAPGQQAKESSPSDLGLDIILSLFLEKVL